MGIDVTKLAALIHEPELSADAARIRRLLEHPVFARTEGLDSLEQTKRSYERFHYLVEQIPVEAETMCADPSRIFALHEWVGLVDGTLCTVLAIHYSLCLGSILHHGQGRRDLDDYVEELEGGASVGVFLATELGYGNNVSSLETEAVYDPTQREFEIHTPSPRAKKYMPNTALPVPKLAIVMARLRVAEKDHGVFPFIVRLRDQTGAPCLGVHITPLGDKPAYALDNAITRFDRVRIPRRNLLLGDTSTLSDDGVFETRIASRSKRFMAAMDRVQLGRVALTGGCVSALRGACFIATRYSKQRETFAVSGSDRPILAYRNQQRGVLGSLATAYALSFGMRRARELFRSIEDEERRGWISQLLSILKAVVSYESQSSLLELRERVGAVGLFQENRISEYLNQVQGLITAEGDNQLILMKSAREMIVGQHYELPDVSGAFPPDEHDLGDAKLLEQRFALREERSCVELRESMAKALDEKRPLFDAWNEHVNGVIRLAKIRGERVLVETFHSVVASVEDPQLRQVLADLALLFALERIERDSGWLLAERLLTVDHVKALPTRIDALCARIEPHAEGLCEGFGITNQLLRAPIASDDYIAWYDRLSGGFE